MVSGESEVIWGCGTTPGQLLKPMIAVQVQPDNSRITTPRKMMRREKEGLRDLTRQEDIQATLVPAFSYCSPLETVCNSAFRESLALVSAL